MGKRAQRSLEAHHSMDVEQVSQRVKMGDQLSVAREIDHTAYFHSRTDAAAAAAELREAGYRVDLSRRGFGSILLEAHTLSDVEWETVEAFMPTMYKLIDKHHGVYDGWGGDVVLKGRE